MITLSPTMPSDFAALETRALALETLLNETIDKVAALEGAAGEEAGNLDILWLLFGTYLVFFMQAGFALLEAGSVRAKNTKNILLKNVLDACLGAMVWWGIGYPFAYGQAGDNDFIGGYNFFMNEDVSDTGTFYATWMFQWAFAAAAATIVSGAVAERCQFFAYMVYSVWITGFTYPVVVHWGWSGEGWLSAFKADRCASFGNGTFSLDCPDGEEASDYDPVVGANGFMDFAGSGIVHMTGGGAALVGAIFLGPRAGRFTETGECNDMPGHSTVLAALGTFILWFGWYGFNPVSTLAFGSMAVAQRVAVTTTLSAAAGGCVNLAIHVAMGNPPDVAPALNGILAGLVGITAPCPVVKPWAAALIGALSAPVYYGSSTMLKKMRIDDPLDASPVHFFCGMWGCISVGLFADNIYTGDVYGESGKHDDGLEFGMLVGGGWKQLGVQLLGTVMIAIWTCTTSAMCFAGLKMAGKLRVSEADEQAGLDESHHGGAAYDFTREKRTTPVAVISPKVESDL
mmetsp:Transcript_12892/g.27205  ORF Transcript_12892/g.27205 Transcript_12892/m.27205 type:complete len:515 (-) Transcript_12892:142-1686(-)|eukprot:CAMPEP_0118957284 /NCGR_PEP_ID=MMETSP1169-20130426/62010_1 /TAXON_ID=36882 /ORGANISM="Pyramimonas obovata, Strain CCMP722" /LENGTH=514 /DNA_ID=CAMNT_0006905347 /DNA_START=96 /DNA_END=1640 /DNA_ORIENTATION=+